MRKMSMVVFLSLMVIFKNVAFAEPFAYVTNYYSQDIRAIDLANNSVTSIIPTDQKYYNGFGVDEINHKIYFGNEGSISVFDYLTDSYITTFPMSNIGYVENIVVSKDGRKLFLPISRTYYPGQIERVEVVDSATYSIEKIISLEDYGSGATFGVLSPDGGRLYVSCRWSNNIVVIDTNKNEVVDIINIKAGYSPTGLAITNDGTKLYVLTRWDGGYVNIIDTNPASSTYHHVIKTVMTGLSTGFTALPVFSPDATRLYFTYPNSKKLVVLNTQTDEIHSIIGTEGIDPSWIIISPDGENLYITSWGSNLVEIINTNTLSTTRTIPMGSGTWEIMLIRKAVNAMIDINPDTLNIQSRGQYITCYIELPNSLNPSNIKIETIKLNQILSVDSKHVEIGDYNHNGIQDLMVKFDRKKAIDIFSSNAGTTVKVKVSGTLNTGQIFEGTDTVKLLK